MGGFFLCPGLCRSGKMCYNSDSKMKPREGIHPMALLHVDFFSDVLESAPDNRSSFIAALASLPPEFWGLVADFARELADNLKAQENDRKTE